MKHQIKTIIKVYYIGLVCFTGISLLAQTTTPTPAPSKTPTAVNTPVLESTAEPIDIKPVSNQSTETKLSKAFTQEDLTVLVGNVQKPNGISWLDGKLYTACNGDWTLYEINALDGITSTFIFGIRDAHTLYSETTDEGFSLWIPDFSQNTIFKLDQRRSSPQVIADKLDGPWGIDLLNENEFVVTNLRKGEIISVSRDGEINEIASGFRSPTGIAVDQDMIYVANNGSSRRAIEWFEYETGSNEPEVKPLVSGLQNVSNLLLADDGYLYFTYSLGRRGVVGRVQPDNCIDSGCSNDQVEIVIYTELEAPLAGLAMSDDFKLYIHSIYRPEIYWVDLYN